jgi:hypothetical protein
MYELVLEFQRILMGDKFLRALPEQHRFIGVPLFIRSVNSVVFAAVLDGDDRKKGDYSGIVKLHNPYARSFPEFGSAAQKFAKTVWCQSVLGKRKFPPVAQVYASGILEVRGETIPWSLEEKLPGKEVKKPFDPDLVDLLWERTGAVAASILEIRPSGYGGKFDPVTGTFTDTWGSYLSNEIAAANLSQLAASSLLTTEHAEKLHQIFEGLRTLDKRYPAALSHRDLAPHNNIFWDKADPGTVLGVIDFEQAASVPGPVYEIAMTQWYEIVFKVEIRLKSLLYGMGINPENYSGSTLEKDCNAVLMLKLCAHIALYEGGYSEEWDSAGEVLPRMLEELSLLVEGSGSQR